jgi:hypothetical protein
MTEGQRILVQTNIARDKAEALLEGLLRARQEAERGILNRSHPDTYGLEAGRLAMQQAISATHQLIDRLNRVMDMARHDLNDDALALLDEAVGEFDDSPRDLLPPEPGQPCE